MEMLILHAFIFFTKTQISGQNIPPLSKEHTGPVFQSQQNLAEFPSSHSPFLTPVPLLSPAKDKTAFVGGGGINK